MYPSGRWDGFWQQQGWGRQSMQEFELAFRDGEVTGGRTDVVGRFTVSGVYDPETGRILLVKQYLGRHAVRYTGRPDGEGCIEGTWELSVGGFSDTGPFRLRPVLRKPTGEEPIQEIG